MTYLEKLEDLRWRERRDAIKRRDNYTCQKCGDRRNVLHVHHREYLSTREPWEYADCFLVTLCAPCHQRAHLCEPPPEREKPIPFSVSAYSKDQLRRFVDGFIWINRNMVNEAAS